MTSAWLTPLTQRTHLITIILVTVLFAFFRLAGGTFSIREDAKPRATNAKESNAKPKPAKVVDVEGEDEFLRSLGSELGPVRVAPAEAKPAEEGKSDNLMDEILGRETLPASERLKREREQRQQNTEGLDDVKKMLGLP